MIVIHPDGPIESGECSRCQQEFKSDIYSLGGKVLCGDCRYFIRHGKHPPRKPTVVDEFPSTPHSELRYVGRGTPEMSGRFDVLSAKTVQHAEFLDQWIQDCSLSIK